MSKREWHDVLPALLALKCREVTVKSVQWDKGSQTWVPLCPGTRLHLHNGNVESGSTTSLLGGGTRKNYAGANKIFSCSAAGDSTRESFPQKASQEYFVIPRAQPGAKGRFSCKNVRVRLLGGHERELAQESLVMAVVRFSRGQSAQLGSFLRKPDAMEFVKMIAFWRKHGTGIREGGEINFLARMVKELRLTEESHSMMHAMFSISQELVAIGKAYMEVVGEKGRRMEAVMGMEQFLRFGATYVVLGGRRIKFQDVKLWQKGWEACDGKVHKTAALVEEETLDAGCEGDSSPTFTELEIWSRKKGLNLERPSRCNGQPPRKRFCESGDKPLSPLRKEQHAAVRRVLNTSRQCTLPEDEKEYCTLDAVRRLRRKKQQGTSSRNVLNLANVEDGSRNRYESQAEISTGLLRELRQSAIALREAGMTVVAERVMQRFLKIVDCGVSTPATFSGHEGRVEARR